MDYERLTKLLMMTTSDNDGEALAAMRKANSLLAKANMNWENFIGIKTKVEDVMKKHDDPAIPKMFAAVLKSAKGSPFIEWVKSAQRYYGERGYLTNRQYETLVKAFNSRKKI